MGQFGKKLFYNFFKKDVQYLFVAAIQKHYGEDFEDIKVDLEPITVKYWEEHVSPE